MLLQGIRAGIPIALFACISALFLVIQLNLIDLIRWNYNAVHLLFGFTAPLAFGYIYFPKDQMRRIPFKDFFNKVRATPIRRWPLEIVKSIGNDYRNGVPWHPINGACFTFILSFWNEIIIDPMENGIPFLMAYGNFLADMLGILLFLSLHHIVAKHRSII